MTGWSATEFFPIKGMEYESVFLDDPRAGLADYCVHFAWKFSAKLDGFSTSVSRAEDLRVHASTKIVIK